MFFGCCNRPCKDFDRIFCVEGPTDLPGQQDRAEKEELTERACFFPATPGVFPKTPWI